MLLLSGPTASGKNTIGNELAFRLERCAVVDFDLIRAMFVNPHKTPWDGEEGLAQQQLGVYIVCDTAKRFESQGWQVVILDVLSPDTLAIYRKQLSSSALKVVQLFPSYPELLKRFDERGPVLTYAQLESVYRKQKNLTGYDLRIDNSRLSASNVADQLLEFWRG
jgi:adenylylsulfate kinase-like enzyme